MTTALRIQCLTVWAILACLAFSSEARAAEPGSIYVQRLLGPSATAPMRDTSARCEMGDSAICWNLAVTFFRSAKVSTPSSACALRNCVDRTAAYEELACALTHFACDGGVSAACAAVQADCPGGEGQSLLASMTSPAEPSSARLSESGSQIGASQSNAERRARARLDQGRPSNSTTASATIGDEGVAVVVAWSDATTGSDPLDAQLVSAVVAQGFRVVPRPLRMAPALFLQQERPDCDPWYLRELIVELHADLAVCASVRHGQLNLTAASLRRDTSRYTTLIVDNDLQVVDGQLAAISLPKIVHPSPSVSVVADLKAAYDAFPTVAVEFPVADVLSLAVRGGYQDTDVEPTPYLMLGLQARLYFDDYQDGVFLGLHADWASAASELLAQSVNIVTTGLSAGYRLDLPFHIIVTPKVEGLLVKQYSTVENVALDNKITESEDLEVEGRATIEVGFKF